MKKLSLLLIAFSMVLFTQCDKDPIEETNNTDGAKMVPISFNLPVDGSKTDFSDFLTDPNTQHPTINWNKTGTETVYLAVPNMIIYNPTTGDELVNEPCAQLVPLTATCNENNKTLTFTGTVDTRILEDGKSYTLYYFGNNNGEDTDIKDENGKLIGKKINFEGQDGSRTNLGNYHVAMLDVRVRAKMNNNNTSHLAESYDITASYPNFTSQIAIAYLDLAGQTSISDISTEQNLVSSVEVKFNGTTNIYDVTPTTTRKLQLGNNVESNSFIALWPTSGNTTINCVKGSYTFTDGIEANSVYYTYNTSEHKIEPLPWVK